MHWNKRGEEWIFHIWNINTLSYKYNKSIMTLEIMTIVNIFLKLKINIYVMLYSYIIYLIMIDLKFQNVCLNKI